MGASDEADDRTFRANFSSDGVVRLQESVKDKLKEFMGDYTDDTLAEYVVVLLRNGRRKEETRKELNVFLEDDSGSFVSWLWDHLSSNLHLYIQPSESDEEAETNNLQREHVIESLDLDSEYKREKPVKVARSQRRRVWNGLIRDAVEPPPLRTSDIESFHAEEKTHHSSSGALKRSWSGVGKELNQQDEQRLAKRDGIKHPVIDAPRRLLQFAVREAVGPMRSTVSRSEPASKRLRSVVSKSTGDTSLDRSQRTRSVARAPLAAAAAQKAAAEAAEDVIKHRSSGNVFDRLGRYMDGAPTLGQDYEDSILMPVSITSDLCQRSEPVLERDTGLASGSESDNGGYDAIGNVGHRFMDTSQTASSRGKDEDSLMVQCSVAQNTDEIIRKTRIKDQDQSAPAVANASRKIVNISVNVNTWKPPHYSSQRDVEEAGSRMGVQDTEAGAGKPGIRISQENSAVVASTEKEVPHTDAQKEAEKTVPSMPGSYSSVRPTEDADSRTVFVCNVHFAATKDLLSRHFNKFGEVLKVIIVTDAATGQPKGSAYVEFMRKEAAELALSLNGTSFMSRILKVVRRGSAHHEAVPMTWPRMPRASPYASRLSRIFARGIPAAFRARLLVKTGPRSLQWKREALDGAKYSQDGAPAAPGSGTALPSPAVRPNTYIRTQP